MSDPLDDNTLVATNFDNMIQASSDIRKEQTLQKMEKIRQGVPLEQINQPQIRFTPPPEPVSTANLDEQLLAKELEDRKRKSRMAYDHMHAVPTTPSASSAAQQDDSQKTQAAMTSPPTPAILDLAHNDDLNIATIARQANKASSGDNEVVISLR
jgi:hypothetical protein